MDLEDTPVDPALWSEEPDRFTLLLMALEAHGHDCEELEKEGSGAYLRQARFECPAGCGDGRRAVAALASNGDLVVKCYRECATAEILASLGWEVRHLFHDGPEPPMPEDWDPGTALPRAQRPAASTSDGIWSTPPPAGDVPGDEDTVVYVYRDRDGQPRHAKRREPGKQFSIHSALRDADGQRKGWEAKLIGEAILYNLDRIVAAPAEEIVLLVEGEKDADTLTRLGYVATTTIDGSWKLSYTKALRGRHVLLLHDADAPGRKKARQRLKALTHRAASVAWLKLPGLVAIGEGADVTDWLEAGHTQWELRDLIDAARATGRPTYGVDEDEAPIRFETFSIGGDLGLDALRQIVPRHHLIQGVLPTDSVALLAAFTNVGKSTVALDLVLHYLCGLNWHGQVTDAQASGDVVWMAGEGLQNLRDNVEGWFQEHPGATHQRLLHIIAPAFEVGDPAQREALVGQVDRLRQGRPLAVLVIDTLNKHFGSGDPNDSRDMTRFIAGCDALRAAYPGMVILVPCHSGWAERGRPRGSSVQVADCETVWTLEVVSEATGEFRMTALKDKGGAMPTRHFRIQRCTASRGGEEEGEDEGKSESETGSGGGNGSRGRDYTYAKLVAVQVEPPSLEWMGPESVGLEARRTVEAMTAPEKTWLTAAEIAERGTKSESTVRRHLIELQKLALIESSTQRGPYRLTPLGRLANPQTRLMDGENPENQPVSM